MTTSLRMTAIAAHLFLAAGIAVAAPATAAKPAKPAKPAAAALVTAPQGGVARWSGMSATHCGAYGRRYAAIDGVCYFPVDLAAKPGDYQIAVWDKAGKRTLGTLSVQDAKFPDIDMTLPASLAQYVEVSPDNRARAGRERAAVVAILGGRDAVPHFSLPLEAPAASMPASEDDFGSVRHFDAKHTSLHTGRDYPVAAGTPVRAVADGTVLLADSHFFTGNAVYVDHGNGLVSMLFHLDKLKVKAGDHVQRGQALGTVGSSGRATGPHLHLGLRWLGKRIDPALLLAAPTTLPDVRDTHAVAERKIDRAEHREPQERDASYDDEE